MQSTLGSCVGFHSDFTGTYIGLLQLQHLSPCVCRDWLVEKWPEDRRELISTKQANSLASVGLPEDSAV